MDLFLINTYNLGKYYNPANAHYNYHGQVNCDRCKMTNIKVCIGYSNFDLCMRCVDVMSEQYANNKQSFTEFTNDTCVEPFYEKLQLPVQQLTPRPYILSESKPMIQSVYRHDDENNQNSYNYKTHMMQSLYKKN